MFYVKFVSPLSLQDGKTLYNELEVVEGMKLDRGLYFPLFHHQPEEPKMCKYLSFIGGHSVGGLSF